MNRWLLSRGGPYHHHGHGHGHGHDHDYAGDVEQHRIEAGERTFTMTVYEKEVAAALSVGSRVRQDRFATNNRNGPFRRLHAGLRIARGHRRFESIEVLPEPHAFMAYLGNASDNVVARFDEHDHAGHVHWDNNMRATVIHVAADAAVSVLVMVGLLLARSFGWL